MEFLRSFLRRHLAGKPVVASPNIGCFLRLVSVWKAPSAELLIFFFFFVKMLHDVSGSKRPSTKHKR